MRIDAYNQISQIYSADSKIKTQKADKTADKDKVEISTFGKIYQTAKNAVNDVPDIREDKVADIKARIKNGSYDVSPESFADKLLEGYKAF